MRKMLKITPILGLLLVLSMLGTSVTFASALPPSEWNPGDEYETTGHYFNETSWTNTSIITQADDPDIELNFTASYINHSGVQVFLVALNTITDNDEGKVGTVPYQLFGMHYVTPYGHEVFIGAVLAFLFAFNDTSPSGGNGIPDGSDDFWFVIPFGYADIDSPDAPVVEPIPVEEVEEGHYRFGMRYKNMWAKVIDGNNPLAFLLSAFLPLLTAKFSELEVVYDITFDDETGEVTAETYYKLGQVEELLVLGIPADPSEVSDVLSPPMGIGAAHYVSVFTSKYEVDSEEQYNVDTGINELVSAQIDVEGHRAFTVGTRGTYDLINETTDETVEEGLDAYNALYTPSLSDLILIGWQLGLSRDIFVTFAYAMSDYLQDTYTGPLALWNAGQNQFTSGAFWYAVTFPDFRGLRVEHDPVYTAYTDLAGLVSEDGDDEQQAAIGGVIVLALILLVAVVLIRKRRS